MVKIVALTLSLLFAQDWATPSAKTRDSLVFIQNTDGSCTGFVIDANAKNGMDRILTAAHCAGPDLFADSEPAKIVWKNDKADLMVLEIPDTGRPSMVLAKANPKVGDAIGSWGYGYSLERPMFRTAHVSDDAATLPAIEGGPFIMIDAGYVSGQSGGPCINEQGEVVSIVQRASGLVGIGVGAEAIRDKVGRYLEKR